MKQSRFYRILRHFTKLRYFSLVGAIWFYFHWGPQDVAVVPTAPKSKIDSLSMLGKREDFSIADTNRNNQVFIISYLDEFKNLDQTKRDTFICDVFRDSAGLEEFTVDSHFYSVYHDTLRVREPIGYTEIGDWTIANTYIFTAPIIVSFASYNRPPSREISYDWEAVSSSHFYNDLIIEKPDSIQNLDFDVCSFNRNVFCRNPENWFRFQVDSSKVNYNFRHCSINTFQGHYIGKEKEKDTVGVKVPYVFTGNLVFRDSTKIKKLDLVGARFINGTLKFEGSPLPDTINLSGAKFSEPVLLTDVTLKPNQKFCYINLLNTDAKMIKMKYTKFKLYFPPATEKDAISATYELLKKSMQENGFNDSYQKLDCEFRQQLVRNEDIPADSMFVVKNLKGHARAFFSTFINRLRPGAIVDTIQRTWWNYGYAKERILFWVLVFLFIFSYRNYRIFNKLLDVYPVPNLDYRNQNATSHSSLMNNRIIFCVMYTFLLFFKLGIDVNKLYFGKTRMAAYIFLQYTIGLICTGFLANWVLKG